MTIRVLVETIDKETFQKILDYYNQHKDENEAPLERAKVAEGGFEIPIPEEQWTQSGYGFVDANSKVRQLRWNQYGQLVSKGYKTFTTKQGLMLYDALVYALPGNVIIE
jgi:hypothetical protein